MNASVQVIREYVKNNIRVDVWDGTNLGDALERAMVEQATIGRSVRHLIMVDGTKGFIAVTGDARGILVLPNGQMLGKKVVRK